MPIKYARKFALWPQFAPGLCAVAVSLAFASASAALEPVVLWPLGAPGAISNPTPEVLEPGTSNITNVHSPSITPYLPAVGKSTGVAVLVIPGGGHRKLCVGHEGENVAKWLVDHGIAAFVLKYRLAREEGSTYTIAEHAMADTRRAVRTIRAQADQWHIDPHKVGAMGFSAGGELVALAAMHGVSGDAASNDPIERQEAQLDFQALIYPGRSADIQPEQGNPPAFLACSTYDRQDISEGLAEAYLRFKRAGVDAELHIYATSGHGFGVASKNTGAIAGWTDRFAEWLVSKKILAQ